MVAEGRGRLAVSKQAAQKLDVERFNIRRPNELEVRKQDQIKISNRCAAIENLNNSEDINRACENTEENIRMSAKDSLGLYELKQHKSWFDEEYLCLNIRDLYRAIIDFKKGYQPRINIVKYEKGDVVTDSNSI